MSGASPSPSIDTLEPLIDAIREGVEGQGWNLSGLQKTSSTEFEGRWAGQTSRSAYLFFHRVDLETVSIEAYLDETTRGLRGNLGLVADVRPLWELESVPDAVDRLAALARDHLPEGYKTPITFRLRLDSSGDSASESDLEARIKLRIPGAAVEAGASAISALASAAVQAFEALLDDGRAGEVLDLEGEAPF